MDLEEQIRSLREQGDLRAAATAAIEAYGPEVFGFLVALLHDQRDASEVFSQTSEDMWVALPRFEGQCSMRTWLYTLARNAAARLHRSPHRQPGRHVALSEVTDVAARVRSVTPAHLRTEVKDRWAAIRESLEEDDRALLVLRVDRAMSWRDIALVLAAEAESAEPLERVEARLRKRFQLVKAEVRKRARQAGLLPSPEP
jgi:RNA polymerase sigma-70 factor (ECF subfamily)